MHMRLHSLNQRIFLTYLPAIESADQFFYREKKIDPSPCNFGIPVTIF